MPPPFTKFSTPTRPPQQVRLHWWMLLWAAIGFIVYGSLFPFDFRATPLPLNHFYAEWHLFRDRSDALDNFLLFVPLGIALHACFTRTYARLIAALFAVLVLAIGIQLVQLYLPSRIASLSDAFWNTVGMGVGFLVAQRVQRALDQRLVPSASAPDYFAMLLVGVWFFYESFPFVPTLDIGLLRDHIKSAIFPLPFEMMRLLQHGLAATLASVAILRVAWLQPRGLNLIILGGLSLVLEICVAYGSLRRETLLGITLGLLAGYVLETRCKQHSQRVVLILALCTYLITVLTPYRAQAAIGGFTFTPFSHLFWQGITKDIPPTAFEALAIGAMLWSGLKSQYFFRHRPWLWVSLVLIVLAVLEWIRVFVVGLHGDSTPLVVALVLSPFALVLRQELRQDTHPARSHTATRPAPSSKSEPQVASVPRKIRWLKLSLAWLGLTLGLCLLLQVPGIPYNLKKIFGSHVVWGASMFSLALLWLGSAPWLLTQRVLYLHAQHRRSAAWVPVYLVGIALVSLLLVDLATPDIMLNKIIGAPDLYRRIVEDNLWGTRWHNTLQAWPIGVINLLERTVRYVALYSVFMIPLTLAALAVPKPIRTQRLLANLLLLLPGWWLAQYIVLDGAITDNLTELITPHGAPILALMISLAAWHATVIARTTLNGRNALRLIFITLALVPTSWWLLQHAIETVVINNGRVFSGLQFLLGENRTALLSESALFARWCGLYLSATGIVALGMRCAMQRWPNQADQAKKHKSRTDAKNQEMRIY